MTASEAAARAESERRARARELRSAAGGGRAPSPLPTVDAALGDAETSQDDAFLNTLATKAYMRMEERQQLPGQECFQEPVSIPVQPAMKPRPPRAIPRSSAVAASLTAPNGDVEAKTPRAAAGGGMTAGGSAAEW